MRTIMATIAAAFFSLGVAAHNPGTGTDNYCVKSIKGKTVVEHNGMVVKKEINFKDGSCIKPDGTVITADGEAIRLKEGECVNSVSVMNLSKHRDNSWHKPAIKKQRPKKEGTKTSKDRDYKYEK